MINERLYKWHELARTALECRFPCPKCGASNHVTGDNNAFFWTVQMQHPWIVMQCPACKCFIDLKKRREGVTVQNVVKILLVLLTLGLSACLDRSPQHLKNLDDAIATCKADCAPREMDTYGVFYGCQCKVKE